MARARTDAVRAYHREWARKKRAIGGPQYRVYQSIKAREWQKKNPVRFALNNTKGGAIKRDIEWAIPDALAIDLITDFCFYCGAAPIPTNGVDRVDNAVGYVETNVVTACRNCNRAKSTLSLNDFKCWILRSSTHLQKVM